MSKGPDDYWREKELESSTLAMCLIENLDEMIEYAIEGEPVYFFMEAKAMCERIVDAFEPEGMPKTYSDNVVSFVSYRARKGSPS